jgi:hypothetical protein
MMSDIFGGTNFTMKKIQQNHTDGHLKRHAKKIKRRTSLTALDIAAREAGFII